MALRSLNIAVIGSGISGLAASWLLSQRHHVTLIEAEARAGGHSHTIDVRLGDGRMLPVDTGFIVSNRWTYPNFTALMDYLDIGMIETKMTFSVSLDAGRFEYSGDHLGTLLGRGRQWVSPAHWRLVSDLVHFYLTAEARAPSLPDDMTLGQYLSRHHYSESFIERHLLPIAGAIWSAGNQAIARYPFKAFIRFFANHKLFKLGNRPLWRTVKNGSREYVRRLVEDGNVNMCLAEPVVAIRRSPQAVTLRTSRGRIMEFDHVVLATHADTSLNLLQDATGPERDHLLPFTTCLNRVLVHRDPALMPRCRRFWSAWNYSKAVPATDMVSVTYWMNALQKLDSVEQHFVSVNPVSEPMPASIDRELFYRHPIFTPETFKAQQSLWDIQGKSRTWFAGAWFGAGFHEDGLQAGLAVAEQLGGMTRPWSVPGASDRIHVKPVSLPGLPELIEAAE